MAIELGKDAPQSERAYYYYLDLLRGLSALLVILEHSRNFLWVDYPEIKNPTLLIKAIYFISGLGHEGVMVFFVLSGCVVGRIAIDSLSGPRKWSWREYLFARLSRLWIVLVPALLLTWVLDTVSLKVAPPESFVFVGGGYAHMTLDQILQYRLHFSYFLANLAFLQTIIFPTFGSNGVLWSLANEFWYYMAFPLLLLAVFGKLSVIQRVIYIALGLVILSFGDILQGFFIWIVGALSYYLGSKLRNTMPVKIGLLISLGFLVISIAMSRVGILDGMMSSYAVAISSGLAVACSLPVSMPKCLQRPSQWLSSFSFSLYIIHAPILTLIVAPWITGNSTRLQPDAFGLGVLAAVISGIYLLSWLFYLAVEHRTPAIRRLIRSKLPQNCMGGKS